MDQQTLAMVLEKLGGLAQTQGGILQARQLRDNVSPLTSEPDDLLAILKALKAQNIQIETDLPEPGSNASQISVLPGTTRKEMGEEERGYLRGFAADFLESDSVSPAYQDLLPLALSRASKYYCEEILFEDLLQEASIALFQAMLEEKEQEAILAKVEAAVISAVAAKASLAESDRELIAKVEKLEEAVRELNDGEGEQFTIAELAVILDKSPEEIHAILRLTGDDEGQSPGNA